MKRIKIKAGLGVGQYILGLSQNELQNILPEKAEQVELPLHTKITSGALTFWIEKESGLVSQIMIARGIKASFLDGIEIGSTLSDLKDVAGDFQEENDVYVVPNYPGICFELEDVDDWDELTAPIEFISVYRPGKGI